MISKEKKIEELREIIRDLSEKLIESGKTIRDLRLENYELKKIMEKK